MQVVVVVYSCLSEDRLVTAQVSLHDLDDSAVLWMTEGFQRRNKYLSGCNLIAPPNLL